MLTRRAFVRNTSLFGVAALLSPTVYCMSEKRYIGVQLYTVRDAMQKDPLGTLNRLSKIGFNSVEGATYTGSQQFYGMDARAFAGILSDNGLIMPSSHYRLGEETNNGQPVKGTILHDWEKAVDDASAVGVKYMVCAYLSTPERGGLDHYKYIAEQLNKAGESCNKRGIQLCYHNHDFEFEKQDNQYPFDVLLDNTDKDLVKLELDLYWTKKAGQDPVKLFEKHPGRFPLWHVKDMDNSPEKKFTEVGNGVIDFKEIFKASKLAGLKFYFVEQDVCPGSPFDSLTQSIEYIRKTNLGA